MAKVGIMAYGTQLDRDKLAIMASVESKSASQWILDKIRAEYSQVFGEVQPDIEAFKKGIGRHI
jgi:hypothetical protein